MGRNRTYEVIISDENLSAGDFPVELNKSDVLSGRIYCFYMRKV